MPAAARRVRQLRLRAEHPAAVQRLLPGLEDALRTASLPDAGGRLLLVRRLALGRIAADVAPTSLALALERAVARARIDCLPADNPAAGQARAVWFRDPLAAHVALAQRLLAGPPPQEWFWPLAVPAWSAALGRDAGLAALARSVAALPEAAVALPALTAALVAAGHRAALLRSLTVALGLDAAERLLASAGDRLTSAAVYAAEQGIAPPLVAEPVSPLTMPASVRVGQKSAAIEAVSGRVAARASDAPFEPATALPPAASLAATASPLSGAVIADIAAIAKPTATDSAEPARAAAEPASRPTPQRRPVAGARAVAAPPASHEPSTADTAEASAATPFDGLPTAAGGLAFVLPVLARLGYPQWLAAHPALDDGAELARTVLAQLLRRLCITADDPAWAIVAARRPGGERIGPCQPPPSWSALALRGNRRPLQLNAEAPCSRAELAGLWLRAVHRALRREARIGFADLVCRPALLQLTPTHLDLCFDLRQIELRVRRAGLDVDPGWLPWFGRVVGFHYEHRP